MRNHFNRPAFYVLNDLAVLLWQPPTTLATAAQLVPPSLQGDVYSLYLLQAQNDWNDQPSYVFDEWTAYTNGLEARLRLGIQDREETGRYALEFITYSACVMWASESRDPQTRDFLRWQTERVLYLCWQSHIQSAVFDRLLKAPDAEQLRDFLRAYYTPAWTKAHLGF